MNLILFELKKAIGSKLLILFLIICIIACGALCFFETTRDDSYFYLQKIEEDYIKDPKAVRTYYEETLLPISNDYERLLRAYIRGEISKEPVRTFPCSYSGNERCNDYDLIHLFLSLQNTDEEWRKQIGKIVETAEINKEELLITYINLDENSFAYRQQDMIYQLYTNVLENTDSLTKLGYGWDQFFSFDAGNIFMLLLILAGAAVIFLIDIGTPSVTLRVSKNGRGKTAIAKIIALSCWTIISVILIIFTIGISVYLKCGAYSDPFSPMASFHNFQTIPYSFSVLEYLFVFIGTKLLLGSTVAMLCSVVCLVLRNLSLGFLANSALVAASFLVYKYAQTDSLKYLNIYGIASFSQLTKTFRCVNVFRHPIPLLPVSIVLLILFLFLFCLCIFVLFCYCRFGGEVVFRRFSLFKTLWKPFSNFMSKKQRKKLKTYGKGLFSFEFRKCFLTRTSILVFVVFFILKIFISGSTYVTQSNYQRTLYEDYMETIAGQNSANKKEYIESEYSNITETLQQYELMRSNFLKGKIEPDEYNAFLVEYQYAQDRINIIERIQKHSSYLDETEKKTGVSAHFLFDLDWIRMFQAGADILLMAYLAYTFSGIFADEYGFSPGKSHSPTITRTTKNGRSILFWNKCIFVLFATIVIFTIFSLIDYFYILKHLNLPNGTAPALSLEIFGATTVSFSIIETVWISNAVKIIAALLLSLISALLGAIIKNKLYTLIASFSIAFVPEILFVLGIKPAGCFSFVNMFQSAKWLQLSSTFEFFGDWGYVCLFVLLYIILSFILTIVAKKEYCK